MVREKLFYLQIFSHNSSYVINLFFYNVILVSQPTEHVIVFRCQFGFGRAMKFDFRFPSFVGSSPIRARFTDWILDNNLASIVPRGKLAGSTRPISIRRNKRNDCLSTVASSTISFVLRGSCRDNKNLNYVVGENTEGLWTG